ncbi:MAG: hypothetical protein WAL91_02245 [Propionicimonas sp.]
MQGRWSRVALAAGMAALALLLTGCDARGTVAVRSATEVEVDLVFSGEQVRCGQNLGWAFRGIAVDYQQSGGIVRCRLSGTLDVVAAASDWPGLRVTRVDDHYVFTAGLGPVASYLTTLDVTMLLPGEVARSNAGQVSANSVRLTTPDDLRDGYIEIVTGAQPLPPWTMVAVVLAAIAGAGLAFGLGRKLGSRGRVEPVEPAEVAEQPATPSSPATSPADQSIWAPPADP